MINKIKTRLLLLMLLLMAGIMTGYAQSNCFTYKDEGKTIIDGLTYAGEGATRLTIPSTVTLVKSGAFSNASSNLTSLTIDGGNPLFESDLFGEGGTSTLTSIDMGHGMTIVNMEALLTSLGTTSNINTIVIGGYSGGSWTKETLTGYTWTGLTSITLPAALVENQEFGEAKVYGRFTIDKEIISFCTNATFLDEDTGSNMLFYVADGIADDGRLHIQRVWYIAAGKGVLIHRTENSSGYADLQRTGDLEDGTTQANTDKALYAKNMLVGVTEATEIGKVSGDKTNYVLKDGAFHPTSGGTIKANRAYLQIPTASARTESLAIRDILPKASKDLKKFQMVKGKTTFASVASDGSNVDGTLTDMEPGNMYKIQVSSATSLDIFGKTIDVAEREQTIRKGYNWIGTLSGNVMSLDEAFADLKPEVGDMVKSRRAYAIFGSRGTWEGILESIVPGEGYVYESKAATAKTFHYPRTSAGTAHGRRLSVVGDLQSTTQALTSHYTPVDDSQFPDNMAFITVVEKNNERIEDAEVGAFINGECRGSITFSGGYYFLTVMGSSADDKDATIELRVWHNGQEYVIENEKHFVSDGVYGTLEQPYVLDLDKVSEGIHTVSVSTDNDTEWYTLQGFKIGRRPTQPGIYIHRGETVVITTKK